MTLLVFLGIVFAWALFTEPHPAGASREAEREPRSRRRRSMAGRAASGILRPPSRVPLARGMRSRRGGRDE